MRFILYLCLKIFEQINNPAPIRGHKNKTMKVQNNTRAELMKFKQGDRVAIFNRITGAESYRGIIETIYSGIITRHGTPERYAIIITENGKRENYLCFAKRLTE